MEEYVVGVDLGGTKIATGRVSLDGECLKVARLPTASEDGLDAVVERMAQSVMTVLEGADLDGLRGIGVGAPGPVSSRTGIVSSPPNLKGWREVPLRDLLTEKLERLLGRPVKLVLTNDANAAAIGEYRLGAGRKYPGLRYMFYMTVSTGIGGGFVADGELLEGASGGAGEIGHVTIDLNGPRCPCGNIGCAEMLAAGPAIARAGAAMVRDGRSPALNDLAAGAPGNVTTQMVHQAASAGDVAAQELLEQIGVYLGVTTVNIVQLFNPELVVIGGGVSKMGDLIFKPIRDIVQERALPAAVRGLRIEPAVLADDVGLLGAASLLL